MIIAELSDSALTAISDPQKKKIFLFKQCLEAAFFHTWSKSHSMRGQKREELSNVNDFFLPVLLDIPGLLRVVDSLHVNSHLAISAREEFM